MIKNGRNNQKNSLKLILSKENLKSKSSINFLQLIILIIGLGMFFLNLDVFGNIITEWLYKFPKINEIIVYKENIDILIYILSFILTSSSMLKIIRQWEETKSYRVAKREIKIKVKALKLMTSKELLDAANQKDKENLEKLAKIH